MPLCSLSPLWFLMLENQCNADVESVEEPDALAAPVRVEGAEIECDRLIGGNRVEEGVEVITRPNLHAFPGIPVEVSICGNLRAELEFGSTFLTRDIFVAAFVLGAFANDVHQRGHVGIQAERETTAEVSIDAKTEERPVHSVGDDVRINGDIDIATVAREVRRHRAPLESFPDPRETSAGRAVDSAGLRLTPRHLAFDVRRVETLSKVDVHIDCTVPNAGC